MRKTFLWIATAMSGVVFAGVAHADTNQGASTREHAATFNGNANGTVATGRQSEPCPPRHHLTAEQRRLRAEAARRAREEREAAEAARVAELQRSRDAETAARDEAQRARDAAAQAELAANQARDQQTATQRALDAERAQRQQLASILLDRERADARHRAHRDIISRGGGPLHYRPLFTFGFDGGVAGFANNSALRESSYVGGSWGARIGVDFADWIGIEGRYFGMSNPLYAPNAGTGTLLSNGGTGVLRLTIPTRWVQPYGFAGVGVYHTQTWRPVEGTNQVTASVDSLAVPAGIGLNVPIGRVVSVAAEGSYHALWDLDTINTSARTMDGIWNGTAVLRFRL